MRLIKAGDKVIVATNQSRTVAQFYGEEREANALLFIRSKESGQAAARAEAVGGKLPAPEPGSICEYPGCGKPATHREFCHCSAGSHSYCDNCAVGGG